MLLFIVLLLRFCLQMYPRRGDAQSCNFVLRYATLAEDLATLAQFSNSQHIQVNRNHKTYSQKCQYRGLSKETQDLIREIYKEDFDRFGYDKWAWPVLEI